MSLASPAAAPQPTSAATDSADQLDDGRPPCLPAVEEADAARFRVPLGLQEEMAAICNTELTVALCGVRDIALIVQRLVAAPCIFVASGSRDWSTLTTRTDLFEATTGRWRSIGAAAAEKQPLAGDLPAAAATNVNKKHNNKESAKTPEEKPQRAGKVDGAIVRAKEPRVGERAVWVPSHRAVVFVGGSNIMMHRQATVEVWLPFQRSSSDDPEHAFNDHCFFSSKRPASAAIASAAAASAASEAAPPPSGLLSAGRRRHRRVPGTEEVGKQSANATPTAGHHDDDASSVAQLWSPPALPLGQDWHGGQCIDGNLVVIAGGRDESYTRLRSAMSWRMVDAADAAHGWQPIASLNDVRSGCSSSLVGGAMWCLGGRWDKGVHKSSEYYDVVRNQWVLSEGEMSECRERLTSASDGTVVWALCGASGSGALTSCEWLDPRDSTGWHPGPKLPRGIDVPHGCFSNGRVFVIGGRMDGTNGTKSVFTLDPRWPQWCLETSELSHLRARGSCVAVDRPFG